jgi:uncharacterized membrane protein YkvA (DUF1232 family)
MPFNTTTIPVDKAPQESKRSSQACFARSRRGLADILGQVWILKMLIADRRVPWSAKAVSGCTVCYLLSPIQLIPTFIPVIGQLDDLLVLYLGMKLVRKLTPREVLEECTRLAAASPMLQRLSGGTGIVTSAAVTPDSTAKLARDDSFQTSTNCPLSAHSEDGEAEADSVA